MTAEVHERTADAVVQLEFELSDSSVPVVAVTEMEGCRFKLEEVVPRGDGCYVTYYSIEGCDPDRVLELATEHETSEAHFLDHDSTDGLLELRVTDDFPSMVLAAHGALPRQLVVERGKMTLAVEVPPEHDANEIISRFQEAYPDAQLTARRQQSYFTPLFSPREFERALEASLTDRQREVLQTAYEDGFYEWPREVTGAQLSEKMGIAPPTLHQHLRAAEQTLVRLVFEERALLDDGEQHL